MSIRTRAIKNFTAIFLFSILFFPLALFSQAELEPDLFFEESEEGENCFDYYRFQSVNISLSTNKEEYFSGEEIVFKGELHNKNNYPVVDGQLFVRIAKKNPNYTKEGHHIIDEFWGVKDINLNGQEKKEVVLSWMVPKVSSGTYVAQFFFLLGGRLELSGLPFTNEVVGGTSEFAISGNTADKFFIDRSKTTVDGRQYLHIGEWPHVKMGELVGISQPIQNKTNADQTIRVVYDFYYWDSVDEKNKIVATEETIVVPQGEEHILTYTTPPISKTVSYVRITIYDKDYAKSIVNVRLTTDGVSPRFNFITMTSFPLVVGTPTMFLACYHNTAWDAFDGVVTLSLFDKKGNPIGKGEYRGSMGGEVTLIKSDIVPDEDYSYVVLVGELTDPSGKIFDTHKVIYDCEAIHTLECQRLLEQKQANWLYIGMSVIILCALFGGASYLYRIRKTPTINITQP